MGSYVLIIRCAALQILPSAYNTRFHGELAVCTCMLYKLAAAAALATEVAAVN